MLKTVTFSAIDRQVPYSIKGPQFVKAGGDGLSFSIPALLKLIQNGKPFVKQSF